MMELPRLNNVSTEEATINNTKGDTSLNKKIMQIDDLSPNSENKFKKNDLENTLIDEVSFVIFAVLFCCKTSFSIFFSQVT